MLIQNGIKMHFLLYQTLTIVASFPHRGTIGPSGFEIETRPSYIPDAYFNYRLYNDGRLAKPFKAPQITNTKPSKPKYQEVHFKNGVSSMIMDIKMPPHYHFRNGNGNHMYNFDIGEITQQLSTTAKTLSLPQKFFPIIKIHQKNNSKQNVNNNKVLDLATFFSRGHDTVDYGYSVNNNGNPVVDDELNSPSQFDKGDIMNYIITSTETATDTESTGAYEIPIDIRKTDIHKFAMDMDTLEFFTTTESYDTVATTEEDDILNRSNLAAPVIASLIGR